MARILVVDDSQTERHVLSEYLIQGGHEVFQSNSGEDGIAKAKDVKPDLVMMDVVMPGLNGFQATRVLQRTPETQNIPVLLCTTKDKETDRIWGMRQGACEYLTKPVKKDELLAKIDECLKR
ncbi:MAG: response regulator [Burkholderiales bacterium]|jgi:twitching motility two-component system response regulator PilH|nr:response regulator [Burkholderiales bacterium]